MINTLLDAGVPPEDIPANSLRSSFPDILASYGDTQISDALQLLQSTDDSENPVQPGDISALVPADETEFKRAEY